jgi:hypothetical protein
MYATCAFSKNIAVRWAEHGTWDPGCAMAMEKEDGSGRAAVRPPVIGRMQCPQWRQQQQSGSVASHSEHAAAVERKAGGRRAGAVAEPVVERVHDFFNLR